MQKIQYIQQQQQLQQQQQQYQQQQQQQLQQYHPQSSDQQIEISQVFEDNVKKYVILDNKIKSAKAAIKELEKEKKEASQNILVYIKKHKLEESPINITGGKIKYVVSKSSAPINRKYIQDRLELFFKSKTKAAEATDFIYANRETTQRDAIRRVKAANK